MEVTLNNGAKMPMVIFGTYEIKSNEIKSALQEAITTGYTHIDTASLYRNEAEIGEALSDLFASGVTSRDKLFITTKVWPTQFRNIREACLNSLKRLKLDYIDQYLLHWPIAIESDGLDPPLLNPCKAVLDRYPLYKAWEQMEALVQEGLVKSIGVSNWTVALLNDMLGYAKILPVTNQFEINPYNSKKELVDFCLEHHVIPVAYRVIYRPAFSPLYPFQKCILDDPIIVRLSEKYGKTSAQILLRWCLMRNCAFIAKSVTQNRIKENYDCQNFTLENEDFEAINHMPFEGEYTDTYQLFGIHLFK
ncbi:hypothetical protein SteCoe_30952 [Stentor coeruleus]|uniref:NADP-dependent oxidoreductase domain-containing protein n=1 Tax=Stentor coeruleus TaxID=5963 RepID=A0A1R2B2I7_9CILI|nr:hypothetical protein SteCoe_30952 [Stentor coeruleus]